MTVKDKARKSGTKRKQAPVRLADLARQAAEERMKARKKKEEMAAKGLNVDGTPLTDAQIFGRRVRQARLEKVPNQAQQLTAFQWGLTPQLLNAIENGHRLPRLETAKKIADNLGIPLDTLTEGLKGGSNEE